ncbi:hypothetical protein ACFLXI_10130 [Chloroflexota bacterium]
MHNRKRLYIALPVIGVLLVGAAALLAFSVMSAAAEPLPDSPNFSFTWDVVGSGGTTMSSASYTVLSTTGQPVVGVTLSENHTLQSGYWTGIKEWIYEIFLPLLMKNF